MLGEGSKFGNQYVLSPSQTFISSTAYSKMSLPIRDYMIFFELSVGTQGICKLLLTYLLIVSSKLSNHERKLSVATPRVDDFYDCA